MKVEGSPAGSPVAVGRMSQLAELRDDEDDWTGVTNSADRRRRQNRLNQRAYRKSENPHTVYPLDYLGQQVVMA